MELIRRFLQAPLTTMARAQLNIHNTINKSRNEMVNTLMDVDSPVPEEIIGQIAGISGVLSVRYLPLRQP